MQFGVNQGSMLSPLLFAIVNIIMENAREGFMSKIFDADRLVLMSESL